MNLDYQSAYSYIAAITGQSPDVVQCDFRMVHDQNLSVPGVNLRGTLRDVWQQIVAYNSAGYGAFFVTQQSDGYGVELPNMVGMRCHFIDLDNPATAQQSYAQAMQWGLAPAFTVVSSPGKAHVYWLAQPYGDQQRYTAIQERLSFEFNSDKKCKDAARIMRLPGTFHLKKDKEPTIVTVHGLHGINNRYDVTHFEAFLGHVPIHDIGGNRNDLGTPELAAPSKEWAVQALFAVDPNELDRSEWITVMSAFKQAAWSVMPEQEVYNTFMAWCAQYVGNDPGENHKQYNSIRNTEVGFGNLIRRSPHLSAALRLGKPSAPGFVAPPQQPRSFANASPAPPQPDANPMQPVIPMPQPGVPDSEILSAAEQQVLFRDCYYILERNEIMAPPKRMLNSSSFKAAYGGKLFVITEQGKTTDDPWKAAIQSTLWTIPKIDHTRFLPMKPPMEVVTNALGQSGINTYTPAYINRRAGNPEPFLRHMQLLMPNDNDRKIYMDYLAHVVKYPGYKVPWAPMLQSLPGAGKNLIKEVVEHAIGDPYIYYPKASELVSTGSKFNGWMRDKLIIWVDEIRVDERRDLVEVLKPMITETQLEIEGKGQDQRKEDNWANWLFFSNYKNAIPIDDKERRYAIFYLAIQTMADLISRGMNDAYFDHLYAWMQNGGGKEIMAEYLLSYPIERGSLPMRAPMTSSTEEALKHSRSPLQKLMLEMVTEQKPGFRNGWISQTMFRNAAKQQNIQVRSDTALALCLTDAGFYEIGKPPREFGMEGMGVKPVLWHYDINANVNDYGRSQGYE